MQLREEPNSLNASVARRAIQAALRNVSSTINSYLPSTINLQWDSNGNLTNDGTRSFAYNPEDRLTNITGSPEDPGDILP